MDDVSLYFDRAVPGKMTDVMARVVQSSGFHYTSPNLSPSIDGIRTPA